MRLGPHQRSPALIAARALVAVAAILTMSQAEPAAQLPLEPAKDAGQSVTAAYEGWFKNADGTVSLLVGYFNRNQKQALDIPIGPANQIEPGGPDQGQPTHFLPGRQWGVFIMTVPPDFKDGRLTWSLVANGHTTSVPMRLDPLYEVEPFKDAALGNTPPLLRFEARGPAFNGPPRGSAATFSARAGEPATLMAWASDDVVVDPRRPAGQSPLTVAWSKFRGPGTVAFSNPKPPPDKADGKITTQATFSVPGEYVLRVQANDVSGEGGGGFQCCWTNAHVRVTVSPAASGAR